MILELYMWETYVNAIIDYTVTRQRIARQRLYKHPEISARKNRKKVYSSLLGNSQRANGLAR
jgi:hypothetical protein